MNGVAIYMEGGGDAASSRAALREGMGKFLDDLRQKARRKHLRWNIVPCGSRLEARDKFLNARKKYQGIHAILLVDAETAVAGSTVKHLADRDHWRLSGVEERDVHLMAQVMETWIVADPDTLAVFYGKKFNPGALPKNPNLEAVSKKQIGAAFDLATKHTQKGTYHKTRHASALFARIRSERVRPRCSHCDRLFKTIDTVIA